MLWCLIILLSGFGIGVTHDGRSAPLSSQKKEPRKKEEKIDYYRKWLAQDVVYIISDEELDVFNKLTTDGERDAFIEQFWRRRDLDPATAINEYKEEHYRRILYANERFTAGIPGWKTDRGRIYITFGPPDRIESMPAGGSYERPRKEGGGHTSVYPFEIWEYRKIEGVGEDIELEFVDDKGGGLYELTFDPQRKDELLKVGFLGPTLDEIEEFELTGRRSKQFRTIGRRFAGDLPAPYRYTGGFETEKDQPFSKLTLSANLNRPPVVRFKDLEAVVSGTIHYNLIPFQAGTASVRVSDSQSLVAVNLNIPHQSLSFKEMGGMISARVQVFGQVTTLSRRVESVFEDEIVREAPRERAISERRASSVFQRQLFLRPGLYKLNLVVKDLESGKLGTWEQRLEVPHYETEELALSSVVLAQSISPAGESGDNRFQLAQLRVVPRVSGVFRKNESMGFYFQIYNLALNRNTLKPGVKIEFTIAPAGSRPSHWRDCSDLAFFSGQQTTVARMTSLSPFDPGDYQLWIHASDRISGRDVTRSVPFSIQKTQ